jgi:hypothetical protein
MEENAAMTFVSRLTILASALPGVVAWAPGLRADTVYLKNGAWIDGIVTPKDEHTLLVEIGDIGKIEIQRADIYEIEKNSRTGTRKNVPVDTRELKVAQPPAAKDAKPADAARPKDAKDARTPAEEPKAKEPPEAVESAPGKEKDAAADTAPAPVPGEGLAPELKKRIEDLVLDLERQKQQNRVRAERHLRAIGAPAVPFLLPLTKSENEATRIAVLRLLNEFGDERAIESCIEALLDANEFVRDLANKALVRITLENFGFQASASPRRREFAYQKWQTWWEAEKAQLAADRKLLDPTAGGARETEPSR